MPNFKWEEWFASCDAFWLHDGNPKRPYARLTSGLISNGFFNAGRIAEEAPQLFSQAGRQLCYKFQNRFREQLAAWIGEKQTIRIIGAEYGGIALSAIVGGTGCYKSAFAQKQDDGSLAFTRADIKPGERLVMIEDTVTTGSTLEKLRVAALTASPTGEVLPVVLAICNRSGSGSWDGLPILSLIQPDFQTWNEGANPFTPDGRELVPPVRPKENWEALTRNYA